MMNKRIFGHWSEGSEGLKEVKLQQDGTFKGTEEYFLVLKFLNNPDSKKHYKGMSICRVCGIQNGSAENHRAGYVWPEGYAHYITEHNVKPPKSVIDLALKLYPLKTVKKPNQEFSGLVKPELQAGDTVRNVPDYDGKHDVEQDEDNYVSPKISHELSLLKITKTLEIILRKLDGLETRIIHIENMVKK